MKTPVSDESVAQYAGRIRAGIPLGKLFPAPMSECDFTDEQRQVIRQARSDRKASLKRASAESRKAMPVVKSAMTPPSKIATPPKPQPPKTLSNLRRMLYLQSGRCFFCGEPLTEDAASIEHLNPKSRGGKRTEDNLVVCHASLNSTFGAMDLKRKFEFVLRTAGKFNCPRG
jgi:5-methylcytosine-specific restriction endonuclease McrA